MKWIVLSARASGFPKRYGVLRSRGHFKFNMVQFFGAAMREGKVCGMFWIKNDVSDSFGKVHIAIWGHSLAFVPTPIPCSLMSLGKHSAVFTQTLDNTI